MSWFSALRARVDNICNSAWTTKVADPLLCVKKEHWNLSERDGCVKIGLNKRGQLLGRGVRALTDLVQHEICALADLAFVGYECFNNANDLNTDKIQRDIGLIFYVPTIQLIRVTQIGLGFLIPDAFVHIDQGEDSLTV